MQLFKNSKLPPYWLSENLRYLVSLLHPAAVYLSIVYSQFICWLVIEQHIMVNDSCKYCDNKISEFTVVYFSPGFK